MISFVQKCETNVIQNTNKYKLIDDYVPLNVRNKCMRRNKSNECVFFSFNYICTDLICKPTDSFLDAIHALLDPAFE